METLKQIEQELQRIAEEKRGRRERRTQDASSVTINIYGGRHRVSVSGVRGTDKGE